MYVHLKVSFFRNLVRVYTFRDKRASSDQRVAELQALIALSRGSGLVGHGHIDPFMA
jgi:hypothetical protein